MRVKDAPRCGRLIIENIDRIMEIGGSERHIELAKFGWPKAKHCTISNLEPLDVWRSDELMRRSVMDHVSIRKSLLNHNKTDPFLRRMGSFDEK